MSILFERLNITEIDCASCGEMKPAREMYNFMSCRKCVDRDPTLKMAWIEEEA